MKIKQNRKVLGMAIALTFLFSSNTASASSDEISYGLEIEGFTGAVTAWLSGKDTDEQDLVSILEIDENGSKTFFNGITGISPERYDRVSSLTIEATNLDVAYDSLIGIYASSDVDVSIEGSIVAEFEGATNADTDIAFVYQDGDGAFSIGNLTATVIGTPDFDDSGTIAGIVLDGIGDISSGNVKLEVSNLDFYGDLVGVSIEDTGNATVGDITLIASSVTSFSTIAGVENSRNLTSEVTNNSFGNVLVVFDGDRVFAPEEEYNYNIVAGFYDHGASGTTTFDSITNVVRNGVSYQDVDNGFIDALLLFENIEKKPQTISVNGNVIQAIVNSNSASAHAVLSYGNLTLNVGGTVALVAQNFYSVSPDYLPQSLATISVHINDLDNDQTVGATIKAKDVFLSFYNTGEDGVPAESDLDFNLFGIAVQPDVTGGSLTLSGDLVVQLLGEAQYLGLSSHSVYGLANASSGYTVNIAGSKYLYFGSSDGSIPFTSDSTNYLQPSFANFDAVVVQPGSSLYLTHDQEIGLEGDLEAFNSKIAVYPSGEEDSNYLAAPLLTFTDFLEGKRTSGKLPSDVVNGIVSMGGVLYLPANTSLELSKGTTAYISLLQNESGATVSIGDGATLTLETASVTATVDGLSGTGTAYNYGTIEGPGSLVFQKPSSIGVTTYDTYGYDGSSTSTTVDWKSAAFVNAGTIEVASMTVGEDASLNNTGTIAVSNLTLGKGAVFGIQAGSVKVTDSTDLSLASTINIGAESAAKVQFNLNGEAINASVRAWNGSSLSFGAADDFAAANAALSDAGISQGSKTLLLVDTPVITGETGLVCAGVSCSNPTVTTGLELGDEAILVVNTDNLTINDASSAAFTSISSVATVSIASGTQIVLYGDNITNGRYYVTVGYNFDETQGESWASDKNIYPTSVLDSAGIEWYFAKGYDLDPELYIDVDGHEAVSNLYATNIPNIVDNYYANGTSAGSTYLTGILRDTTLSQSQKVNIINSSSAIAFSGGVLATAMNDMNAGFGSLYDHLLMISDTFGDKGNLWPYDANNNLWIDVLGNWNQSRNLSASGIKDARYRDYSFGFIAGYDRKLGDFPVVLGGAFSFTGGQLKSRGGVTSTKNDHQSYGVHLYGNWSANEHLNVIGSLHWLHNNADLTQSIGVSGVANKATASPHTDIFAVGLRFESTIRIGEYFSLIPHVEPRYLYSKTGKYDTFVDGGKVWSNKNKGNSLFQIPVGVGFRGNILTESGWNWRPNLDVQVIPQVGSTRQHTTLTNVNNVSDTIYGEYKGKFAAEAKLGVDVDKGPYTFGVKYGFGGGTKGKFEHGFILQGKFRF